MSNSPENKRIAFIGTGVMGRSMAGHLQKAGHQLFVYNRTKSKAQELLDAGAQWCDSPGEAAAQAEVVFTIVGYPEDVRAVYLASGGIVDKAPEGAILVDMTTSSPELAVEIAEAAEKRKLQALDAPVSGGDVGAKEARLSIMVGGAKAAFESVQPLFDRMGQNIVYQGKAGSGQFTKMANQIAIASTMMGVCESLVYAQKAGLDPQTVLASISKGAAGSFTMEKLAPRMLDGNFAPGFYVKHFIKDMRIAIESAENLGLELPGLAQAKKLYDQLQEKGGGDDGTQALYKLYAGLL